MIEEKKKYNYMEPILYSINKHFIKMPKFVTRRNKKIVLEFEDEFISKMKESNVLFAKMFKRISYGGSIYDGLRVKNPTEFDLVLLFELSELIFPDLLISNKPGFVQLKLNNYDKFFKQSFLKNEYKGLEELITKDHFLSTSKVHSWMEKVVQKALNKFPQHGRGKVILNLKSGKFFLSWNIAGPAVTVTIESRKKRRQPIVIDIDLVPGFAFETNKYMKYSFIPNSINDKLEFYVVPKPLNGPNSHKYWRLSFQEQERTLIHNMYTLKPTIKLLKKMRDSLHHFRIQSYYIKTILLHVLDNVKNEPKFWNNSLSYVFMTVVYNYSYTPFAEQNAKNVFFNTAFLFNGESREEKMSTFLKSAQVLKEYHIFLENGNIPFYWNKKYNLIKTEKDATLENFANRIRRAIREIEQQPEDPYVVAKYILSPNEFDDFMNLYYYNNM